MDEQSKLRKIIAEQIADVQNTPETIASQQAITKPVSSPVEKIVKFDSHTASPWEVEFYERGFAINGTRLSFELLEDALSKNLNLVLNKGAGLELDAIKMNKILKYKPVRAI